MLDSALVLWVSTCTYNHTLPDWSTGSSQGVGALHRSALLHAALVCKHRDTPRIGQALPHLSGYQPVQHLCETGRGVSIHRLEVDEVKLDDCSAALRHLPVLVPPGLSWDCTWLQAGAAYAPAGRQLGPAGSCRPCLSGLPQAEPKHRFEGPQHLHSTTEQASSEAMAIANATESCLTHLSVDRGLCISS